MRNTATVAVLFCDVVGSTERLTRLGDEAGDEFRRRVFAELRRCVVESRGAEVKNLGGERVGDVVGDATHARVKLGWSPRIGFPELVAEMVREDLRSAERDELVKRNGYEVFDYDE